MNLKLHIRIALGYFLIIAVFGLVLRLFQVIDISVNYKHFVHVHSHIALLGWIYTALTTLIYKVYLSKKTFDKKYRILFWTTQATLIGMLISFPITGYGLFSIVFSTLFLFASYGFVRFFLKYTSEEQKETQSYKLIRTALWFMVFSSVGPWVLGIIMNTLGSSSSWYRNAIYFYLHFQYNGWFLVALFGFLFFIFEKHGILIPKKTFNQFFWIFNSGVVLTFFLSVLWMKPHPGYYILSGVGGLFQFIAFGALFRIMFQNKHVLKNSISKKVRWILILVGFLLFLKLIAQFLGSIPSIAEAVSENIDLVIGYLHWVFLGIVSMAIFAFLNFFKLLHIPKNIFLFYFLGFLITEGLLFYKGAVVWLGNSLFDAYFIYLFLSSTIFLVAIVGMFYSSNNRD